MRISAVAALAALLVTPVATPARAAGAGELRCWLYYNNEVGVTSGRGDCYYRGTNGLAVLLDAPIAMAFSANNNCPTQTMSGGMSGSGNSTVFTISRVANVGVASFRGSFNWVGPVHFLHPCPVSGESMVIPLAG